MTVACPQKKSSCERSGTTGSILAEIVAELRYFTEEFLLRGDAYNATATEWRLLVYD